MDSVGATKEAEMTESGPPDWTPSGDPNPYEDAQGREWFCPYCERRVKKPEDHKSDCPRRHESG